MCSLAYLVCITETTLLNMLISISKVTPKSRLNLLDDVLFVVLDVETTGLDDKSCHVIQLAAKVLGSDDENDLFSGKKRAGWFVGNISIFDLRIIHFSSFPCLYFRVYPSTNRSDSKEN